MQKIVFHFNRTGYWFNKPVLFLLVLFQFIIFNSNAQNVIPTKGKDFWLGFMENDQNSQVSMRFDIFVTSLVNTSGTISVPGQSWSQTFSVSANVTTTLSVPLNVAQHSSSDIVETRGVHIVTNDTVSVFAINFADYTADGTQVFPTQSLGTRYRMASYNGLLGFGTLYPSEFIVVATEDGTQVKITTTGNTMGGHFANVPFYVNLNQGESYQVKGATDSVDFTGSIVEGTDTSGTCRPFAVFSGVVCAYVPTNCQACDHLFDECLPTRVWGNEYYAPPFSFATSYTLRVLADQNNTTYTINGGATQTLNAGQFDELNGVSTPSCVVANKPISVIQYMEGITCVTAGDPSMLYLNAADQKIDNVTFSTVTSTVITQHVVNVIMNATHINQLTLDGVPVAASSFQPFPSCPSVMYAQLNLTQGSHSLSADSGFTAYAYGTGSAESYAYSVGSFSKRKPIVVDSILCTTDTVHIGTVNPIYNSWWSTQTNPTDTIGYGQVLTLVPPIIPDIYILHGDEMISGCSTELYFSVEIPTMPTMWIHQSADTVCKYQDVQLTSGTLPQSSVYLYSWSPSIDLSDPYIPNPIATPPTSRWYVLTITSPTGCGGSIKDSIFVYVNNGNISNFNVLANDTGLCIGDSALLNINVEANVVDESFDPGITPSYWSSTGGGVASTICGSVSGNAFYFNSAGTRELISNPIDVSSGGNIKFSLKIATGVAPCDDADPGENVVLEYSINGGLNWISMGLYNEASYPVFTVITVPIPVAARTTSTKFRWSQIAHSGLNQDNWLLDNILISAIRSTGYNFSWSPSLGLSGSNIPNPVATPNVTTQYVGMAIDTTTGCIYTDSVNINVNPNFTLTMSSDTSLCQVTGIQIFAVPNIGSNYTYAWTPSSGLSNSHISSPIATPLMTTQYSVSVTSQFGCVQTGSVNIDVLSHTIFNVMPDTVSICFGDTIQTNTILQTGCGTNGSPCGGSLDSTVLNNGSSYTYQNDITPFSASSQSAKRQLLFTASELNALGMTASTISAISFSTTLMSIGVQYDNFTIKMGCTSLTSLSTNFVQGLATVYNPQTVVVNNGVNTFTFNATYDWDGVSNLIIEICYDNQFFGNNSRVFYHLGVPNSTLSTFTNGACAATSGSLNYYRPNIVFKHCASPVPNYTYSWTPTSSVSNPSIMNPVLTPTSSTTYYVTATDGVTGCILGDSLPVIVGISNLQATVMNDTTVCTSIGVQLSVTHNGSGSVLYNWQPSANLNNSGIATPTITVDGTQQYIVYLTDSANCSGFSDTVNVNVIGAPAITITNDTTACAGDTIHLSASGGTLFNWTPSTGLSNPSSATPTAVLQAPAVYHVTVTDNIGCSSTDSVEIQLNYFPIVTLGNDTTFCRGGQAQLTANGNATFLWSDGSSNSTFTATESGTYWVAASNQCGVDADSVDIVVNELPVVDIGNDTSVCVGTTVILDAGNPGATYNWSTANTTQTISPSSNGFYQVTVTDLNSCVSTDNITLTFIPLPVLNIGNDTTICDGDYLTLDAGNPGMLYTWSTGESTQAISTSNGGTISVVVMNSSGCSNGDLMLLTIQPLPVITVTNNSDLCMGDSIMLNANSVTGTSYQWSPATALSSPASSSTWANPVVNTTYYVHVIDSFGCAGDASLMINMIPMPAVQLGNDTSICIGESVTFNAVSNVNSYIWNIGSSQNAITVSQAGKYWVNSTNACGTASDTISILKLYDLPVINLGSGGKFCENTPVVLDAGNAGSDFLWVTGETTQSIVASVSGNYTVLVIDANKCRSLSSAMIDIVRLPNVSFEPEIWLCEGEQILLNAKSDYGHYTWQDGSGNESYVANHAGIYWVNVNNMCGDAADTIKVGMYDCQCEFYVPNAFTPNADGHNDSFLALTVCELETYDLKIYNRWGEVLFESTDLATGWDGNYNGNQAPEAVYTYLITYTGHANTRHVSDRVTGSVTLVR